MADVDPTNDPTPIPTPLNVTALARQFGLARTTVRRRLKKGWVPPARTPRKPRKAAPVASANAPPATRPAAPPNAPLAAVPDAPAGRTVGLVLVATAVAIATLAIGINAQTGWRYGTSPLAAWTFAGLSITADMLAIVLPSAAVALWWNRRRTLSGSAWATWGLAATMATMASVGFASLHIGDTAATRAAIVTTSAGQWRISDPQPSRLPVPLPKPQLWPDRLSARGAARSAANPST